MRISISGTYSAGKTSTAIALSYLTGIPRSPAKTIREIMPDAVPGKALNEVTPAEYIQLAVRRHVGRAVNEALLGDNFIADGSSLQEWTYAAARVEFGMDPGSPGGGAGQGDPAEMAFFGAVAAQLGHYFKQHVVASFDAYVHLRREFGLSSDGHRPMSEQFRAACDDMLLDALKELQIPYFEVSGTQHERLEKIVERFDLPTVRPVDEAIELAKADYAKIDWRLEKERTAQAQAATAAV